MKINKADYIPSNREVAVTYAAVIIAYGCYIWFVIWVLGQVR
jgi:hypothetical protein